MDLQAVETSTVAQRGCDDPSARLITCARPECGQIFHLCSPCDRGNKYCSDKCAIAAKREQDRISGQAYQSTPAGARRNANRQNNFRGRKRLQEEKEKSSEENFDAPPWTDKKNITQKGQKNLTPEISVTCEDEKSSRTTHTDRSAAKNKAGIRCHFCGRKCAFDRTMSLSKYRRSQSAFRRCRGPP